MMFADEKWKKQTGDRAKLRLQALDGVQKSCQGALKLDVDYVIHMHSDAWTLSEEGLIRFIGQLKDRKKMLAVRGDGLEHVDYCKDPATACGHLDDHFFAFNRKYFEENKILDFIPEELFPHKYSIHGMLMMLFTVKVGLHNIWYYRFTKDMVNFDGKRHLIHNIKPSILDTTYGFLHVHRTSLPNDYGRKIQAMYLKHWRLNKQSLVLYHFIQKYYSFDAIQKLLDIENRLNGQLRRRLFPKKEIIKREITIKQNLIDTFTIRTLFKNIVRRMKIHVMKKYFPVQKDIAEYYDDVLKIKNDWSDIYD